MELKKILFAIFVIITMFASCTFLAILLLKEERTIVDTALLAVSGSYLGSIFMYIFVIVFKEEFEIK